MSIKYHHTGIVVNSIEEYEKQMLFENKIAEVVDNIQSSKLALYKNFGDSYIELIEPINDTSTSYNALKKYSNHYNHICYKIDSKDELEKLLIIKKWIRVFGPVPAVLFNNCEVVFYVNKSSHLIEFLIDNQ